MWTGRTPVRNIERVEPNGTPNSRPLSGIVDGVSLAVDLFSSTVSPAYIYIIFKIYIALFRVIY